MKKYFIVLLAATLSFAAVSCGNNTNKKQEPTTAQNSNNAVRSGATPDNTNDLLENYMGTYRGVVPCADCEGIDMKLMLNKDYTYSLTSDYKGKGKDNVFKSNGKWKINESLNVITLDFDKPKELTYYKIVDNNTLQMLDKEGKEINTSHNYYLTK